LLFAFNFALLGSKLVTFRWVKMPLKAYLAPFKEVSH
jgi:hypothetical protein